MLTALSRFVLPPVILFTALATYRVIVIRPEGPPVVLPRNEPLTIAPRYADERVVTDDQLLQILARVLPPSGPANTNAFVHALRLWGPNAHFAAANVPSGSDMRNYFLDDSVFRRFTGENTPPLIYQGRTGIEIRSYDDHATNQTTSSYHTDDILATLAESGTSLDTPIHLRDGDTTVRQLLTDSLSGFHLERFEYEWTGITYARYVFPQREWKNRFGERITVDALVAELVSHPPELGPCNGLHRQEALAVLNCADEQFQVLKPRTKQLVLGYLQNTSAALAASQSPEGFWTRDWHRPAPSPAQAPSPSPSSATLHEKLLITGHHLEWLALAPAEIQPPRETIIRAAQWLARTLLEMDEKDLAAAYGPYSHAARALSLWRGAEPWDFWSQRVTEASVPTEHSTPSTQR